MSVSKLNPFFCVAMICGLMLTTSLIAQQPQHNDNSDQQNNQQTQSDQNGNNGVDQWINSLSDKVDLKDDQKQQIREQLNQHSQKITSTWQKFNQSHMTAVMMEAQLYAALEDQMNTQQQQQFRQQRNQSTSNGSQANSGNRAYQQNDGATKQVQETSDRTDTADSTASNDSANADTDRQTTQAEKQQANQDQQAGQSQSQATDKGSAYVTQMILVPVQRVYYNVSLDDFQKSQCNETCSKYHDKLTTAWNEIHQYHDELVKLEAEKIEAIEAVLTEDQLTKLRDNRKSESDQ